MLVPTAGQFAKVARSDPWRLASGVHGGLEGLDVLAGRLMAHG